MSEPLVEYECRTRVALVKLNRPERLNALTTELLLELSAAMERAAADPAVRSIVLTGAGSAFCAGADLAEVNRIADSAAFYRWLKGVQKVLLQVESVSKPTVCAINGLALGGGCELTLVCDFRLAAAGVPLGTPEVNAGVLPAGGGMSRLTALIGLSRAKEMVLLGHRVTAEQAAGMGLVHAVAPPEQLLAQALHWAEELAAKPPLALQLAKCTMHASLQMDFRSAAELEAQALATLFATKDRAEGTSAFLEKRPPVFTGN